MWTRPRIFALVVGVLLFLVASALLARWLSTENAERNADLGVLQAEAAGNAGRLISEISGCAQNPACVATETKNARALRRPGQVKILELQSPTAYALKTKTGTTRIAWTVIGRLPVVQCVRVRRSGNALSGLSVSVLALGPRIVSTGVC